MKTITGHLTETNKKAIKAILAAGLTEGSVNKASYFISEAGGVYSVTMKVKDKGLIPVPGSALRLSTYKATFTI